MVEMLFLGGPAHGRVIEIPDAEFFRVPRPGDYVARRDEASGVPLLSGSTDVLYRRKRLAGPSTYRDVMVDTDMPPDMALQALADVLIALWVAAGTPYPQPPTRPAEPVGPEPDEDMRRLLGLANARVPDAQAESGPEPGPAAPLAGDQPSV